MEDQPEALRLADALEDNGYPTHANELRRQHAEIERLTDCLKQANVQAEHFEREWYLRGDAIERKDTILLQAFEAMTDTPSARGQCKVAILDELSGNTNTAG